MDAIKAITGTVCPIDANDIDTDQIIPKQFLKRIERTGFGPFAFYEWRYEDDGETPKPDFPMNLPEHAGASILLAGRNFGCGSSREHAPWAIEDAGFKAIVAPSFADIFRSNCAKIGLVAVELPEEVVRSMFEVVAADPRVQFTVDLESRSVSGGGIMADFTIDEHTRHCLMNGLDDVGLTLQREADIAAYEATRPGYKPAISAVG